MKMTVNHAFNVTIIGAGVIGTRLASAFSKVSDFNIKFICDVDLEKATVLANKYSSKPITNYKELINDETISVVYIGVPPTLHKELTIAFLQAGKHVICEKPLALSVSDCQQMITARNNSHLLTAVNLPLRYTIVVIKMKELLSERYVGDIQKIDIRFRFPIWPRAWQNVPWLAKKVQGGPLREVGTHFFFLLHELFGDVEKILSIVDYPDSESSEIRTNGIIKLKNGLLATVDLIVGSRDKEENSFTVIGKKGTLSFIEWYKLLGTQTDSPLNVITDARESSELQMVNDFSSKLKNSNATVQLVNFEEALYAQKILEAILNSNESWINIE